VGCAVGGKTGQLCSRPFLTQKKFARFRAKKYDVIALLRFHSATYVTEKTFDKIWLANQMQDAQQQQQQQQQQRQPPHIE
jgi:hypothetical protein